MSSPRPARPALRPASATILHVDFSTGNVIERFSTGTKPNEISLSQLLADSEEFRALALETHPNCDHPLLRMNHRNLVSLCRTLIATFGDLRITVQLEGVTSIAPATTTRRRQRRDA